MVPEISDESLAEILLVPSFLEGESLEDARSLEPRRDPWVSPDENVTNSCPSVTSTFLDECSTAKIDKILFKSIQNNSEK